VKKQQPNGGKITAWYDCGWRIIMRLIRKCEPEEIDGGEL
jgi:hypothetical protein